jgi:hypothetical protein
MAHLCDETIDYAKLKRCNLPASHSMAERDEKNKTEENA